MHLEEEAVLARDAVALHDLRRLARATYAVFVSLLPATATVIGVIVLAQIPRPLELAGVCLVVSGVAVHREPIR